ncbi:Chaperone protein DnaJ [Orchesella cincta]|uniref:Chaperone protein DnaJ n=1 Tax=Orchesella cincta TaxID=48709 RepID=A0A1D2M429_ORCCI|nr:Chaperone protein DnaJ [Orchesella cincta]
MMKPRPNFNLLDCDILLCCVFGDIRDYLKDLREILIERERARADTNNFQWAPPPQPENEEPPPRHENQQRRENPRPPPPDFLQACVLIFRYRNILGLPYIGSLSRNEIEKAYKQGAMKWHPDKNREKQGAALEEVTSKFRDIKEARDVLLKLVEIEE